MASIEVAPSPAKTPHRLRALPNFKAMQMPVAERFRLHAPHSREVEADPAKAPLPEANNEVEPRSGPTSAPVSEPLPRLSSLAANHHTISIPKAALIPVSATGSQKHHSRHATNHVLLTRSSLHVGPNFPAHNAEAQANGAFEDDEVKGQFEDAVEGQENWPRSTSSPEGVPEVSDTPRPREERDSLDLQLRSASIALQELRDSVAERPKRHSTSVTSVRTPPSLPVQALRRFSDVTVASSPSLLYADTPTFAHWKAAFRARRESLAAAAIEPMSPDSELPESTTAARSKQVTPATEEAGSHVLTERPAQAALNAPASAHHGVGTSTHHPHRRTVMLDAADHEEELDGSEGTSAGKIGLVTTQSPILRGRRLVRKSPTASKAVLSPPSDLLKTSILRRAAGQAAQSPNSAGFGLGIFVDETRAATHGMGDQDSGLSARAVDAEAGLPRFNNEEAHALDKRSPVIVQSHAPHARSAEIRGSETTLTNNMDYVNASDRTVDANIPTHSSRTSSPDTMMHTGARGRATPLGGGSMVKVVSSHQRSEQRSPRMNIAARHWNVTSSAAAGTSAANGAQSKRKSVDCPETKSPALKSWTSSLAKSAATPPWSSPQPTGANSASSTPAISQTPAFTSAPASPMPQNAEQSSSMAAETTAPASGAPFNPPPAEQANDGDRGTNSGAPMNMQAVVAASTTGAILLILACLWAFFARKRRTRRQRHLSVVLRKFVTSSGADEHGAVFLGDQKAGLNHSSSTLGSVEKPASFDRGERQGCQESPVKNSQAIDSVAYFSQQRPSIAELHPTIISPWLQTGEESLVTQRLSADLARSGLVSASPSKDASFTWQHPTLSLPPAAARAMVTSHYVKRRSAMPEKLQGDATPSSDNTASGVNVAAGQWRSDAQGQLVYTVTNPDDTLVSEAYASSAYVDPSLAGSSPARISRQISAESQVTALVGAMRPRSESMSGSGSRSGSERVPWIGALLRGLPRNSTSTPPRARFSLPVRPAPNSLSSLSSPATHAMSTASTRDNALFNSEHTSGSETGDVRFVSEVYDAPSVAAAMLYESPTTARNVVSSAARASGVLMKGRTRSSTISHNKGAAPSLLAQDMSPVQNVGSTRTSLVQLPNPNHAASFELPRPNKFTSPMVVISRPGSEIRTNGKRMSLWRTSLSTCRENSVDSLSDAAEGTSQASRSPLPSPISTTHTGGTFGAAWAAALPPQSDFDSSEDDLRQGYEAGEETDGDAVSSARFSARYLSQGSRARSEMTYGGSNSGESSASSMPATPTKLIIDDQLPSLAHINKSIPSPNGVHKRAPRLPPMPLITLTLDDGLVQRPISLTSDSSSDVEHDQFAVDRAEVLAEAVAASFCRDEIDQFTREPGFPRVDSASLNRPPSAVTQTRLALRTFGTEDSLTRRMLDGEPPVLQSDDEGEDEQRAGTSGSAQRAASLQKHTSIPTHDSNKATVRRSRELSEEGYGSDSAEGCLEHDDFPTLPAWTPMRRPGQ
ncbi:hypothetical protein IE81DRAFT_78003 [Ceraceosorus guamensis]|uniref:Uncharacterized protein n=1 Tax=Ceraceosorus guamensis TaxID=1522189 RepID=A0A316W689_9BASI|nr:hypothetical protein IE81DRAFT_78003 [Ceraceosorus guamensis]PWN43553.1 hypothetical protein IE81DRAFT_78003 [Ceraceosorus guamensis]